jgi:hypothetical protein
MLPISVEVDTATVFATLVRTAEHYGSLLSRQRACAMSRRLSYWYGKWSRNLICRVALHGTHSRTRSIHL